MPSEEELERWAREDDAAFDRIDRLTPRVGRWLAVMVPTWIIIFWAFAEMRALPGVAFVLASIFSIFFTFVADRFFMVTPRTKKWIPLAGVGLLAVWLIVLPFLDVFSSTGP